MIRIGILGYGNLGRGVEYAVEANEDMELVAVFTRRDPASVKPRTNVPVVNADKESFTLALTRLWNETGVQVDWSRPVDYVKEHPHY